MKLRTRVVLTTIAVAIPVLVVMVWVYTRFTERVTEEAMAQVVTDFMHNGGRAACEASPTTWAGRPGLGPGGPGPPPDGPLGLLDGPLGPPEPPARPFSRFTPLVPGYLFPAGEPRGRPRPLGGFFGYDAAFAPSNPNAPPLDVELRDKLQHGEPRASRRTEIAGRVVLEILVRMPWQTGPCSYVLARRPGFRAAGRSTWELWVPVVAIILAGVLIAIGPVVRRIRQLTREVRASARGHYRPAISVTGDDEIGELSRAFNDAGHEIRDRMLAQERRERTLRDFLDNTTHDVMTPLTVLLGHLSAIAERAGANAPADPGRVNAAMNEAHYMAALIHNLSLAAKLEAGEPDVTSGSVDLNALIERVVARHAPVARKRQIALEHATPEAILRARGDVTFVEQAVSNIVLNAVQHSEPNGHIAVLLDRTAADQFAIRISDDGPGMTAAELGSLSRRGSRGIAARTRAPHGRGLGLHIAQRVVALHRWTLTLSNAAPRGLEVVIAGPLEPD